MKKKLTIGLSMVLLASSTMTAMASSDNGHQYGKESHKKIQNVQFSSMDAPSSIENMVKTYTESTVKVTFEDGTQKEIPLSYDQLYLTKDKIVENNKEMIPAGTPIDVNGDPIIDNSIPEDPSYYISDAPDSNSLIKKGNKTYMISHFEYDSQNNAGEEVSGLPASMTLTEVKRDKKTGKLSIVKNAKKIDFANVNGLWIPCNGSTTDWGTHMGSEEYEPDARAFENKDSDAYKEVRNYAEHYFHDASKANPYFYGWIPEISITKQGEASVEKHYSTGRFSHEMMKVLPDNKTALFGDDGGNTMSFMYVADKAEDFSSGTLYAAKFEQTGTEKGGSGDLKWIKLGHASDQEVLDIINSGVKFSDIFETAEEPTEGFTAVKTNASDEVEYLKVKPGMEKAAAFLESRRYGAIKGATSEFNKMEGIAVNKEDKKAYMAISYQEGSMEKEENAVQDDIQLPKLESGVTYELNLQGNQADASGSQIASEYVPSSMQGFIIGKDLETPDALGNTADPDQVANPDNLSYSEDLNTLFIGEDSGMHTNNFVWAYNLDDEKLSRILSVPVGAEATGLSAANNVGDSQYVLSNYQHPGADLDEKEITAVDKGELEKAMKETIGIMETGGVGYISGIPALDDDEDEKEKEEE
ncbi:PhoX family protein [Rossellomorea sp. NS-SX7]|uniref:PhoX family protein n=1 Tax=Rossellomorea sp. NS-SX7 TaxID=3463856 RepID=UPI004058E54B